jgi:pyrroloquinoline quinone biosynthesis protein E
LFIREAGSLGIPQVNLSGGETMLYPHLMELISCCRDNGVRANVALSGYGFDREVLSQLIDAGVGGIFISLNGSTEEINRHSRDGYELAINALEVLRDAGFPDYYINWVAHRSNVMDFPDLLSLAGAYRVPAVVVMAFKPDSRHALPSFPTREQLLFLADYIKRHQDGAVKIVVENCFSQLKAVIGQKFFVNLNQGIEKGCQAGRDAISVSVSGKLTPCRHLEYEESYTSIAEYWSGSPVLRRLRDIERDTRQPCRGCEYERYCLHCMAVNAKLKGELFKGNEYCELAPERTEAANGRD